MIKEIVNVVFKTQSRRYADAYLKSSFSQCGEDGIVDYIFSLRGIQTPTYIDIGANHPFYINNTAVFYLRGARGVNVEANSVLVDLFKTHRSADTNLNCGVGPTEEERDFFIFDDDTLSTFSSDDAEDQIRLGKSVIRTEKIRIKTLQQIVDEYCNRCFPDFLSIDVEGVDFEIMQSTDFTQTKPKVICAETAEYSPTGIGAKRMEYIRFIESLGYFLYADTNLNSIFVENHFWFDFKKK